MELRTKVPRSWREALQEAADSQAISVSDLMRLILRSFLRGRYSEAEREALR